MTSQDIYGQIVTRVRAGESVSQVVRALATECGRSPAALATLFYRYARRDPQAPVHCQPGARRGRPPRTIRPDEIALARRLRVLESDNARLRGQLDRARRALAGS